MRILMLSHRMPYPPTTGDKVRAYHVARHLARQHELTLAFLVDDADFGPSLDELRRHIPDTEHATLARSRGRVAALARLAGGGCATMAYFDSAALREKVAARLAREHFDAIYVHSSSMAQYIPRTCRVPVVMDFVDIDSEKWTEYGRQLRGPRAWVYRLEATRLREHEILAARVAARCLVVTPAEADVLHSFAPWAPTTVMPNGVDLDYFAPAGAPAAAPTIVFTGAMDYYPNVDAVSYFCDAILPRIHAHVPDARFVIAGKNPSPVVRRLANDPAVVVTGTVPDVRPYLRDASVAVAPLRVARGVQNKVLEAMAMARPVVATESAYQGLDARRGREVIVEDDPTAFANAVATLLYSTELRQRIGTAARTFVETHHSWPAVTATVDDVLSNVTRQTRPIWSLTGADR